MGRSSVSWEDLTAVTHEDVDEVLKEGGRRTGKRQPGDRRATSPRRGHGSRSSTAPATSRPAPRTEAVSAPAVRALRA